MAYTPELSSRTFVSLCGPSKLYFPTVMLIFVPSSNRLHGLYRPNLMQSRIVRTRITIQDKNIRQAEFEPLFSSHGPARSSPAPHLRSLQEVAERRPLRWTPEISREPETRL